jgi:hypothetical protein
MPLAPAVIDAVNGAIYVHFNLSQLTGVLQLLHVPARIRLELALRLTAIDVVA